MKNALEEFLAETKGKRAVKCASITYNDEQILLPINYSSNDYAKFYNELNFEYDSGWGSQNLYGTIWMDDGTWFERYEYDGKEKWSYKRCPRIPNELKIDEK